jgi:hypothetical protein
MGIFDDPKLAPITSASMPQFTPPPAAPPGAPQGLLARAGSAVKGALGNARDNLFASPDALKGMINDDDVANARRQGLLQMGIALSQGTGENALASLGRGLQSAQGGFQQALAGTIAQKEKAAQTAQQQQLLRQRVEIAKAYPARVDETPEQTIERMQKMFAAYTQIGDLETAGKIGEVVKSLGNNTKSKAPTWEDFGGYKVQYGPDGQEIQRVNKTAGPRNPDVAADVAERAADRREQANFRNTDKLAQEFTKDTESYRALDMKLGGALAEAPRALAGDGAAQTNVLYTFVTAMDPNSAVREGELALVQAAASLRARAQNMIAKAAESGKSAAVPRQMIQQMADLMQRRQQMNRDFVNDRADHYTGRARNANLDPTGLFPRLGGAPRSAGRAAPAKKATGKLGTY